MEPSDNSGEGNEPRDWWRVGDAAVLLAYVCVVAWTIRYHEKWADEAQAWLIARDLDLPTIWFHELRYEGSPGLWHTILWVAQHVFHAGYGAIGYIGLAFSIAGVAVLLFFAPFPRIVRWPLAFTYFLIYQYAVIARPYTLMPLLAFLAAVFFKDVKRPERVTITLILLANLSLHGAILAGCLGVAYLWEAMKSWAVLEKPVRRRYVGCVVAMSVVFLFLAVILKPTPDVEEFAMKKEIAQIAESLHVKQPTAQVKLLAVVSGAFLDYTALSVIFILLAGAWCAMRRRLLLFAVPVALLITLYVAVHGYAHHHGTVFIAAITALWIAWPSQKEQEAFTLQERRATQMMMASLVCLCAIQIWDSAVVIRHEYLYPYSGAEDAANYLKSVRADSAPMFGYLYGIVGVQAYFDRNILSNIPTTYFHHGLPLYGTNIDLAQVERVAPRYVIIFTEQPQLLMDSGVLNSFLASGYRMVHFSDGYEFNKRTVYVRQAYLIFRRTDSDSARWPLQPSGRIPHAKVRKMELNEPAESESVHGLVSPEKERS